MYVDSASVTDSLAQIFLIVRHGEYTHREVFGVVSRDHGTSWGVRDVRLWGATQAVAPRPRPQQGPAAPQH